MLDASRIRDDPDTIRAMLRARCYPESLLDDFLRVDGEWRTVLDESNRLKHTRNVVSQEISGLKGEDKAAKIAEMRTVSSRIKELDQRTSELEAQRHEIVLNIPNVPHPTVPIGECERDNVNVRGWGTPREFDFTPKDHIALGEELDIIDFVRGTKIAGSGFYVLKGDGARLERALINLMLDIHRKQGYKEVFTPVIVNHGSVVGTGQYPKLADDMYRLERDDMWLNPTAEVPITNLHSDEIFEIEELPVHYTGYLPSFRREAGRHADMKGIIRVHQFNKVEMVKFVHPDTSYDELNSLLGNAEEVVQALKLPYRVLLLCTGDISFSAAKCYDIEAFAPGSDQWLEISSCSNFEDFQARRAKVKYRPEPHLKSEFVHTINGSGIALPRTMVAVLENYQNADGTVTVPEVLRPYMQGQEIIG